MLDCMYINSDKKTVCTCMFFMDIIKIWIYDEL